MARLIKTSGKKGGSKKAVKVVTKTKRVFVKAKKKIRKYSGVKVSKKEIIVTSAAAGAGAVGAAIVVKQIPATIPGGELSKNAIVVALGGVLAYRGFKKNKKPLIGAGLGMAAVGVTGMVKSTGKVSALNAPFAVTPSIAYKPAPMAAPFVEMAAPLAAPFAGEEDDLI